MAPRGSVVLVIPPLRHWERAVLLAELAERGQDVVGMESLDDLVRFRPEEAGHAPVGVVLVDREALADRPLSTLRGRYPSAAFLLLTGHLSEVAAGPWRAVLMRPLSVGQVAETVATHMSAEVPA